MFNRAVLEEKLGRHKDAAQTLEQAAQLDPKNDMIAFNLAVVLTAAGESARAIAAYERTITLDPKNVSAYYNCAALYERAGNLAGAIEKIEAALKIAPDNTTLADILNRLKASRDKRPGVVPVLPGGTLNYLAGCCFLNLRMSTTASPVYSGALANVNLVAFRCLGAVKGAGRKFDDKSAIV